MYSTATYLSKQSDSYALGSQCVDFHRLWVRPELLNCFIYIAANNKAVLFKIVQNNHALGETPCADHHVKSFVITADCMFAFIWRCLLFP